MKRIVSFLGVLLLLAGVVGAQQEPLTGRDRTVFRSLFRSGNFGPPRYAAAPVTCAAATNGLEYYDTVTNTVKFCNASSWVSSSAYAGTTLVPAVSTDLGATATPFRNLYLYGSGTFATTYLKLTGTPTGTRTVTFPDATDTVAELGAANAFTGANTFASTSTFNAVAVYNASVQGNFATFALSSGAGAVTFAKVTIPSNSGVNLLVEYAFEASTATPHLQEFGGTVGVNAVNVGGAITCVMSVPTTAVQPALATDGGTLTNAITCADGTGGVLNILATDTSSITPTTNRIRYRIRGLAATTLTVAAQ